MNTDDAAFPTANPAGTPTDEASGGEGAADRSGMSVPTVAAPDAADAVASAAAAGVAYGRTTSRATDPRTAPDAGDERLRTALARSARRFTATRMDSPDNEAMLAAIVTGALEAIPAATAASITMIDQKGTITTHAPSDELVAEIDAVQAELGEGPCIDAINTTGRGVTDAVDLADPAGAPWPRLAPRAREAGYGSVLSYQLTAKGAAGALNLWGADRGHFTDRDRLLGALFADQAAVALTGARRADQLNQALASRDLIGRAKGIVMERFRIPDAQAFALLVESSQNTNMKLVAVAEWLVREAESGYAQE